jgi:hypothetical protein
MTLAEGVIASITGVRRSGPEGNQFDRSCYEGVSSAVVDIAELRASLGDQP